MNRLIHHLESCLFQYPSVVVPGLGVFLLQRVSAQEDKRTAKLLAPHYQLHYSPQKGAYDGRLQDSYMHELGIEEARAEILLKADVAELLSQLEEHQRLSLGSLGTLLAARGGESIRFIPNAHHPFQAELIGLEEVYKLPVLLAEEKQEKHHTERTLYIPVNLRALKYSAAAVLVLAMGTLLPLQRAEEDVRPYQSGFVPEFFSHSDSPISSPARTEGSKLIDGTVTLGGSEQTSESLGAVQQELRSAQAVDCPYLVVVASVRTERLATAFVSAHETESYPLSVKHCGSYYRVYTSGHATQAAADKAASELRNSSSFKDAWVYKLS